MDQIDRKTLLQCAELLIKQAATLRAWEKVFGNGEIAHLEMQGDYAAQVRRSQPHLDRMKSLGQDPSADQDTFDTLRKLLGSIASPSLSV
jgi:hypothetical protein